MYTALQLFNEQGFRTVTVENICEKLEISKGNFNYHFRKKESLIELLYDSMVEEVHKLISEIPFEDAKVSYFLETHQALFHIQAKYRFFFLNLFEILSHYPSIKEKYLQRYELEKSFAFQSLKIYMEKGVLRKDIREEELDRIIEVGYVLNNSWAVDAEIHFQGNEQQKMIHYLQLCCGRLEPYLSSAARKEYLAYFDRLQKEMPV
ncbi:MAG: TetR/AcrR family transcriptional regulator [Bacteroidia bacterium]|nr:TetR/AcrR family transcriptional regulator [Bacteroidia bacterium]